MVGWNVSRSILTRIATLIDINNGQIMTCKNIFFFFLVLDSLNWSRVMLECNVIITCKHVKVPTAITIALLVMNYIGTDIGIKLLYTMYNMKSINIYCYII